MTAIIDGVIKVEIPFPAIHFFFLAAGMPIRGGTMGLQKQHVYRLPSCAGGREINT